jgi:hypothetical protein
VIATYEAILSDFLTMNWRQGLFRLWLVLAISWLIVGGGVAFAIWNADASARESATIWSEHEAQCGDSSKRGPWCDFAPVRSREYPMPTAFYPDLVIGPPILLFILGWMGLWVARGFTAQRLESR